MAKSKVISNKKQATRKTEEKVAVNKANHILKGRVVAATMPKTVTVLVERKKTHPLYGKSYVSSKRYLVHTDHQLALGDVVEMAQIKPMSKNKFFAITRVVGRDIEAVVSEQLKEEAAEQIAEVIPEEKEEIVVEKPDKSEPEKTNKKTKKVRKDGK